MGECESDSFLKCCVVYKDYNTRTEQLSYSQHTLLYGVGRFNGATETKGRWWNSWDLELCPRYHSLQSSSRNITFSGSHFTIVLSHLFAFRNNDLSNSCWEILREMKNTDLELFPENQRNILRFSLLLQLLDVVCKLLKFATDLCRIGENIKVLLCCKFAAY